MNRSNIDFPVSPKSIDDSFEEATPPNLHLSLYFLWLALIPSYSVSFDIFSSEDVTPPEAIDSRIIAPGCILVITEGQIEAGAYVYVQFIIIGNLASEMIIAFSLDVIVDVLKRKMEDLKQSYKNLGGGFEAKEHAVKGD
ncbi:hypothetical protein L2E82_35304 [Cichorium intybus]|uniref:Uncharacterized protein n=1 Tax=Cichorium intybus TaxID=13427 RepID=A0ACB9BNI4_CICIN|nr:hypothetical protein L2E82_35304 [Cichorium intybus]